MDLFFGLVVLSFFKILFNFFIFNNFFTLITLFYFFLFLFLFVSPFSSELSR